MDELDRIDTWVLPTSWCYAKLEDVGYGENAIVDGPFGSNLKVSDYIDDSTNGVPVLTTKNLEGDYSKGSVRYISQNKYEELKRSKVQPGDILVAKIGSIGKTGIYPSGMKTAVIPANLLKFTVTPSVEFKYVFAYLNCFDFQQFIKLISTATAQPAFNVTKFRKLPIPLPPINEQHRIVAKIEELFSELDKGVEYLKIAQGQLKVYRQALLKHAFEGKLTAQWREQRRAKQSVAPAKAGAQPLNDMDSRPTPSRGLALRGNDEVGGGNDKPLETAADLLKRIQQERAQRYQQQLADWEASGKQGSKPKTPKPLPPLTAEELAELPELPEGWGWVKYGDLCLIVRNGISAKPEGDSGTPIFRISAVRPLFFDMKDIRFINNSNGEFDAYYLERGDLVFTRYNGSRHYVGVCAEYRSDKKYLFPDKLVQTRVFSENVSTSYLEKALNSGASRRFIDSKIRTTAGQSGISGDDIRNIPVPLCSTDEQMQIVEELESKLSETDQLDQTITTSLQQAEALRQSILKKAFSGQLVPQDPNDEPASELLARIKVERLASQGDAVVRRKGRRS
ncbi:restriction endonuclease subunit S [Nitrosomonas sp. sh817]|uniref:restriction endonuclease subunit S n=1 Tax=Nitrosomonas sp. sh817 TaxID=3070658 RepID=UPI0027DE8D08|nr:restriction endonuclease subunit S [Nitrosomonas sp. sh817]WMJ07744.1 restriction endonuclease subunit S [Nitrosomonas sp. sh817]